MWWTSIACAIFIVVFLVVAYVSEKLTPLVGIGGLLILLALAGLIFH